MKTFIITTIILLASTLCMAQEKKLPANDLEIANALIAKPADQVKEILNSFDIDYWYTSSVEGKSDVYIQYNNSIRLWEIKVDNIFRTINDNSIEVAHQVVTEVFVRYRHSNLNDLRNFYFYEKPDNKDFTKYEKELGSKISHFRIKQD